MAILNPEAKSKVINSQNTNDEDNDDVAEIRPPESQKCLLQLQEASSSNETVSLFRKGPIKKLYNIVTFINRSPHRQSEFEKAQRKADTDESPLTYQLVSNGGVRWNSTYLMICWAIELKEAIDLFVRRQISQEARSSSLRQRSQIVDDEL